MLPFLTRREREELARLTDLPLDLAEFVTRTPGLDRPDHLRPLLDIFARIADPSAEPVRVLISTPPQHGKSVTVLHALVWLLLRDPRRRHAYVTYAQAFSRDQSTIAHRIAEQHHLPLDRGTLDRWATPQGGGVVWTSRGGPFTGNPVDGVVVVDDLLKDREEANSHLIREKAMGWLSSVAFTRMHPGASFVLIATRWHLDDPTGRLAKQEGYEVVSLPAITDEGEALWPEHRPLAFLEQQRANLLPSDWSALFMCQPVADGSRVFGPSTYYEALPKDPYREAHGFDAAYTAKTSADYSVTLTGRKVGDHLYLTNLIRAQSSPEAYVPLMKAHGVDRVTWYRSGTEKGMVSFLQREGIRVKEVPASADKLARAIPAAVSWNRGEILLPSKAEWAPQVEAELSQFTGRDDPHDDIVDALAALHYDLMGGPKPLTREQRRSISPW